MYSIAFDDSSCMGNQVACHFSSHGGVLRIRNLCGCSKTPSLILTALDVVWSGGRLSAVTTLVVMSVGVVGAGLASSHPIRSTHSPSVPVNALITECADPTIHRRLLVVW